MTGTSRAIVALLCLVFLAAGARPAEKAEEPAAPAKPPEGAIVLFDGTDTKKWQRAKMTEDGCLVSGATTKGAFQDFTLHLEFLIEPGPDPKRRVAGNSGVYLQRRYEIQILNTAHKKKAGRGDCGAIYQVKAPSVNAAKPPGQWQSYDITFQAPRWEGDKKVKNARISVVHNGIKIHDEVEVPRKTGSGRKEGPEPGPIYLQAHGGGVLFRNVWIVPKTEKKE